MRESGCPLAVADAPARQLFIHLSTQTVQIGVGWCGHDCPLDTLVVPGQDTRTRAAIDSVFTRPDGDTPEEYPHGTREFQS
ncbi:hypothetical protein NSK11_contig00015-0068 [Nocardia seriolae]|uniref:4Fe-4S ferredoxin-type domain-containing protein n=1 Tax=Nocardia seriolae TaxID=37332 RepID=A0ABC9YP88_9NOCA|nr:hypothetical protein NS14008_10305 [Nocardia seriolae]PSK32189.1 hypothetical protein C6575_06185 [Nocardia seriolae]RLP32604.1 hypothetical protein D6158_07195 [Nocardia seriolae]GAM45205.1 hypothetical protein NS07_v2contig00012-0067 [Nocardia seriolae]GAP27227.1 hypothetical protein NSK11_contig00015-0068 [Nocardia seriolae]